MDDEDDIVVANHRPIWLKVAAVAYVCFMTLGLVRFGVHTLAEYQYYLVLLIPVSIGMVVGLILYAIFDFVRRPALLYAIGHLIIIAWFCWIMFPEPSHDKDSEQIMGRELPDAMIIYPTDTASVKPPSSDSQMFNKYDTYIEKVKNEMTHQFPDGNFEYHALCMKSLSKSAKTPDSILKCYVLYSVEHNGRQFYFDKYIVSPSSLEVEAHLVSAKDLRFRRIATEIIKDDSIMKKVMDNLDFQDL